MKRRYLNSQEENFFMMMASVELFIKGKTHLQKSNYIDELEKRGMLTKESKKQLKMATTYMNKFLNSMYEELDEPTQKRIQKRLQKFEFKVVDDFQLKRILRTARDRIQDVVLERETFEDIIEDIAECNCKDCTKGYEGCKIYKVLDEALIDKPGIEINCPYAWNSKE